MNATERIATADHLRASPHIPVFDKDMSAALLDLVAKMCNPCGPDLSALAPTQRESLASAVPLGWKNKVAKLDWSAVISGASKDQSESLFFIVPNTDALLRLASANQNSEGTATVEMRLMRAGAPSALMYELFGIEPWKYKTYRQLLRLRPPMGRPRRLKGCEAEQINKVWRSVKTGDYRDPRDAIIQRYAAVLADLPETPLVSVFAYVKEQNMG
jgi:hypothetical protein